VPKDADPRSCGRTPKETARSRIPPATTPLTGRSVVAHSLKHARMLMVQKVAMKSPPSRIVGVESHNHGCFRRHQHRVAQGAGKAIAVDGPDSSWPNIPPGANQVEARRPGHGHKWQEGNRRPMRGADRKLWHAPCSRIRAGRQGPVARPARSIGIFGRKRSPIGYR
jgi:hypothetical protein